MELQQPSPNTSVAQGGLLVQPDSVLGAMGCGRTALGTKRQLFVQPQAPPGWDPKGASAFGGLSVAGDSLNPRPSPLPWDRPVGRPQPLSLDPCAHQLLVSDKPQGRARCPHGYRSNEYIPPWGFLRSSHIGPQMDTKIVILAK